MRIVPANKSIIGATVTGTVDADYINTWLTDGNAGYPAYKTGSSLSLTASFSSRSIDVAAVVNHALPATATIGLSGALGSIPTAAWRADGIPYNWVRVLATPATLSSIALSITGAGSQAVVGELYAGASSIFPAFLSGLRFTLQEPFTWEGEYPSLAPYDAGVSAQRRIRGSLILLAAEYAALVECYESQRRGSRPLLMVEDDMVNDAWLCQINFEAEHKEGWYFVDLEVAEIPRLLWVGA